MPSPLVSVIIPTYNQAPFLEQALISLRDQSYSSLEVIAVNDGSTDETGAILEKFQKEWPALCILTEEHRGVSATRNTGIRKAQGEWICFLDSDDWVAPNKFNELIGYLEAHPAVDIVYGPVWITNEEGKILNISESEHIDPSLFLLNFFFRNPVLSDAILGRAACFKNHLFDEQLRYSEDYEFFLRLAHQYRFAYHPIPLTYYRRYPGNTSNQISNSRDSERRTITSYSWDHMERLLDESPLNKMDRIFFAGKLRYNREEFEEALSLLKDHPYPLGQFYAGNSLFQLQRISDSIDHYREAHALAPGLAEVWNNLGAALFMLGNMSEAKESFLRAANLRNNYQDPQRNLKAIETGSKLFFTFKELRQSLLSYHY